MQFWTGVVITSLPCMLLHYVLIFKQNVYFAALYDVSRT